MAIAQHTISRANAGEPTLAEKVAFLSQPPFYPYPVSKVTPQETHMSWVFLADDKVYKLKKPVRFPYLDFSTLARREAACRAELNLNRRLAPDVYLDVVPLVATPRGLSIGGAGEVADWLVVMRRLKESWALDRAIDEDRVETPQLDRLVMVLSRFYGHARRPHVTPGAELWEWKRNIATDSRVLLDRRFNLPSGPIWTVERAERSFLSRRGDTLLKRVRDRRIVDGHGDLRPEHIWLCDGIKIIDCLEFNPRLRAVDPFDELAYLSLECERLGAAWIGDYVCRGVSRLLHDDPGPELFLFYRCHRALLRARLAVAHLMEPNPRTPEKWPQRARAYLSIAVRDAARLERLLRTPGGRSAAAPR